MPLTCDYSDTDYKADFWDSGERVFEDLAERIAIKKLLPERGRTILDLGAGFGRLTGEYVDKYSDVVLFDYAQNLLNQAEKEWYVSKRKTHVQFVQGDARRLPFADKSFDVVLSVRMMHHLLELDQVLGEVARVLRPGGCAILEFANKRHAKERIKRLLGKSDVDTSSWEPYQRGNGVFFNFHPDFVKDCAAQHRLTVDAKLSVSNFRMGFFKQNLRMEKLLEWEDRLQEPLGRWDFGPSIFYKFTRA